MKSHKVIILLALLYQISAGNKYDTCGEEKIYDTNGTIKINTYTLNRTLTCKWTIFPPPETITSIRLVQTNVEDCVPQESCCLSITDRKNNLKRHCNENLKRHIAASVISNEIPIIVQTIDSYVELWLEFSTRKNTQCPNSDFQCKDNSKCYDTGDICTNDFICADHSDNLGCGPCKHNSTPCDNDTEYCFDLSQRCDGALNCPRGEDELNCTASCRQLIKCPREEKCITQDQVCNRNFDCAGGADENHCPTELTPSKGIVIIAMFILCSTFCLIFICLVFRWVATRRDVATLLNNLPEFPLAPFQGPGEQDQDSSSNDLLEADFRQGGEIFENYMQCIKKKTHSKSVQVGTGKYSHLELDGENELVVLASLNVPTEMCVGLTITDNSSAAGSKDTIKTLRSIRQDASSSASMSNGEGSAFAAKRDHWNRSKSDVTIKFACKTLTSAERKLSGSGDHKPKPASHGELPVQLNTSKEETFKVPARVNMSPIKCCSAPTFKTKPEKNAYKSNSTVNTNRVACFQDARNTNEIDDDEKDEAGSTGSNQWIDIEDGPIKSKIVLVKSVKKKPESKHMPMKKVCHPYKPVRTQ